MNTEPAVVYRTNDAVIVSAWDEELARREALRDDLYALARSVDPDRPRNAIGNEGTFVIIALSHQPDWPVPTGWIAKHHPVCHIVPNRRTKAGRDAATALRRVSPGDPRDVLYADGTGMPGPGFYRVGGTMRYVEPGVMHLGDWLYVAWAAVPAEPADATRWETVPLSVYYAAREALNSSPAVTR